MDYYGYKANKDAAGTVIFYHTAINGVNIPQDAIEVSNADFEAAMNVDRAKVDIVNGALTIATV